MTTPELTIVFSGDAIEWDEYLCECFAQMMDSHPLTILHERIEDITFPINSFRVKSICNSKAVLLILSPDFLDFIDAHAEVFELSRLLHPERTIVMLCGVHHEDISRFHKAALVSYDQWPCLVAKDQDKDFVLSVIQEILNVIQKHNNGISSSNPQFKLSPRKVREGNGKVFVLLEKPITQKQNIQILFDGSIAKHVTIKWRNPFTLHFIIPERMLKVARVINVSIICDDDLIGIRPIKCESKMSSLHSLLSSVNSPFDLLCQTFGMETLRDVDAALTKRFKENVPNSGFMLLEDCDIVDIDKKKSDCNLPTLLHFAAQYGLRDLTSNLLHCPRALKACQLRNAKGLTPAQLARHEHHTHISTMLEDFQRLREDGKINLLYGRTNAESINKEMVNVKTAASSSNHNANKKLEVHHRLYDVPFVITSQNVDNDEENIYLQMSCLQQKADDDNLGNSSTVNNNNTIMQINDGALTNTDISSSTVSDCNENMCSHDKHIDNNLQNSDINNYQTELNNIIESFKNGAPLGQIEIMFKSWKFRYQKELNGNIPSEMQQILTEIKMYSKEGTHSVKSLNEKHVLSFSDLHNYLTENYKKSIDREIRSLPTAHKGIRQNYYIKNKSEIETKSAVSIASLSSISSSSSDRSNSNVSLCDSGNHSADSPDEAVRLIRKRYTESSYYKFPITKSCDVKMEFNSLKSVKSQKHFNSPPAPPPRPINITFRETNEFNETTNLDHQYYLYSNGTSNEKDKALVSEPEEYNKDIYIDKNGHDADKENLHSSLFHVNQHQYANITSNETLINKHDPLTDYDRVPTGKPIPIPSKDRDSFAPQSLRQIIETDYDIPKSTQLSQSKVNIQINNTNDNGDEKVLNDDERQIFV